MKDRLQQFVCEELLDGRPVEPTEELLLSGLLDSLGVMRLVGFIEESLGIAIPAVDVTIEHFATLERVDEYLSRYSPE